MDSTIGDQISSVRILQAIPLLISHLNSINVTLGDWLMLALLMVLHVSKK